MRGLNFLLSHILTRFFIILVMSMAAFASAKAQNALIAVDTIRISRGDTLQLSHKFLVPFSEKVLPISRNSTIDTTDYQVNYLEGYLLIDPLAYLDTVWIVQYRYFFNQLKPKVSLRNWEVIKDSIAKNENVELIFADPIKKQQDIFWDSGEGIRKSGSLSRGLTVGNNRGLSVTSGLRLQLEGDLGDGLEIVGAITDENLPIQAGGTTQQISDFDKIFIRLSKDEYAVTIGDYEVNRKKTRFSNLYRNVQGLRFSYNSPQTKASASGAVAKGKFHTNSFMGIDGVSGPYRLTGRNRERFFIVLAGSEKVYLNGKLMKRGENQDYIIDYNTAEVTFTARNVITNITRIVVDFEYNDRYFNRSLVVADMEHTTENKKLSIGFSYSRDADNANAPFDNPEAFEEARSQLSEIGDQNSLATTPGIFELGFSENEPRYERSDTLIDTVTYERYIFSTNSETAVYGLLFSFVGQGNGFYTRDRTGINNNIFVWVPPNPDGTPAGDFAPVRTWVLPRLHEVIDARLSYQLNDKIKVFSETALSREDENRLSSLDDEDNTDIANKIGLSIERAKIADSLTLSVDVFHQYVGERYNNLDRLYQAEYGRVWNFDENQERRNEHIAHSKMVLDYQNRLKLEIENGIRNTGPQSNAIRQVYGLSSSLPGFLQGNYTLTRITNEDALRQRNSQWTRHEGDIFANLGKWQLGTVIWIEDREEQITDSITNGTFSFVDLKPYLKTSNAMKKFQAEFSWNYRSDQELFQGMNRNKAQAYTWFARTSWNPTSRIRLQQTSSYRVLNVRDTVFYATGLQDSRVLNTNFQATVAPKNQLVFANLVYDVNSEQLARQEIRFIEVNPGQGQYVWLDSLFNNDGIQDFAEFQLANNPLIANFIRVVVPTRELFPTSKLSLNANMRWNLKRVIPKSDHKLKQFVRNIGAITNLRMSQNKTRNTRISSYFIDLTNPFADSSLLNANYNLRQDITFFQNHPRGDIRFSYFDSRSKLFLSTGDEFRGITYYGTNQRLNLNNERSIELEAKIGNKFVQARAFDARNYSIDFWEVEPKINFQFNRKLRLSSGYGYSFRQNENGQGETDATINSHKLIFDSKWNIKDRNNIFGKLELINLIQDGEPGFSAGYELREGLQPGFNAVWQVFLTVYLLKNLELGLTYDGRASVDNPVLHTGRVQVRAFF
jgi:hypothetical protein